MKKRKKGSSATASRAAGAARREPRARAVKSSRKSARPAPDEGAPDDGVFLLSAECTVAESDSIKNGLKQLLATTQPVTVDVSQLQRIDTAGMQLLAAFVRERESQGRQVQWRGSAPVFTNAVALLGLAPVLRLAS